MIPIYSPPERRGKSLFGAQPSPTRNTGYSPKQKKMRSSIEFKGIVTQSDDLRLDELQYYQREGLGLQRQMAWEQRRQSEQLGFITRQIMKICGHSPAKDTIHRRGETSTTAKKDEPNSWERTCNPKEESEPSEHHSQ